MLAPLIADTDWTVVIASVGSAAVLVIGAIGREVYKIKAARWARDTEQAVANEKAKAAAGAAERRQRRDTNEELYRILDVKEKDGLEWRKQVHELRGELGVLSNRLAVCEWDRKRLQMMQEDQGAAIAAHGIQVHYRTAPDEPPGPVEPHGPAEATTE